jgi:tetratricopeptide (TPR) repeat protein
MECQSPGVSSRHIFWLAREYTYVQQWDDALKTADRYLACDDAWIVERAWANVFKANAYAQLEKPEKALSCYMEACKTTPGQREPWLALAGFYSTNELWPQAYGAICNALAITGRPEHYLTREDAWNHEPHDLAGLFSFKLNARERFTKHVEDALQIAPHDEALRAKAQRFGIKLPGS